MVSPVSMNDCHLNCEESSERISVPEYDKKNADEMDKTKVI